MGNNIQRQQFTNINYNDTARYCKSDISGGFCKTELSYLNIKVIMQGDGNLVMYDTQNWQPLWATGTNGRGSPPYKWYMQGDGNLVIYDRNGRPIWATGTNGKGPGPFTAYITDDGNLLLIDKDKYILWNSNTINNALPRITNGSMHSSINRFSSISTPCLLAKSMTTFLINLIPN
jgi:hypothetical protein